MSKPPGIGLGMGSNGPRLYVTASNRATDEIWEAVRSAIDAGMSPEEFRSESRQAWAHYLEQDKKHAVSAL